MPLHILRLRLPAVQWNSDEHAQAKLCHPLRRVGAYRGAIEATSRMRVWSWPDAHLGNLEVFAVMRKALIRQGFMHDFGGFDETARATLPWRPESRCTPPWPHRGQSQ